MTARHRRLTVAALVGSIVTGSHCGVTSAPLANLATGLILGVPAAIAALALLAVARDALGGAR